MVQSNIERKKVPVLTFDQFVKVHKSQLVLVPKLFWRTLYEKITFSIFDLNKHIQIETKQITYSNQIKKQVTAKVCNKNGLRQDDPQNIFLIQHLVHYYATEGRELMKELINSRDPLLNYLKKLMDINDTDVCSFINNLLDESWKYVLPFQIKTKGNKKSLPIWSITEQAGMVIRHSDEPNFMMITFQYLNLKRIYSVLFPIKSNIKYGDEVTRDYTYFEKIGNHDQIKLNAEMQQEMNQQVGIYSPKNSMTNLLNNSLSSCEHRQKKQKQWTVEDEIDLFKRTLLIPWQPENLQDYYEMDINFQQHEPCVIEFFDRRLFDQPYSMMRFEPSDLKARVASKKQIKVYCDDKSVMNYLSDPRFAFVNDQGLADIWWFSGYFMDFAKMYEKTPLTLINQFPLSHLLNEKDALPVLCRRKSSNHNGNINPFTLFSFPSWLPTTFNLTTELVKFTSYYCRREQKNLENTWIVKPINQTNSADVFITNNLSAIIRLRSCFDRVACKYIANPLLFYRTDIKDLVKFELKYFVVLTSVLPLKLFVFRAFVVDFSNKPFDLTKLYNQEMHLTDMSCFNDQVERLDLDHIDFINRFNYQFQYTKFDFEKIDTQIMLAIREMFELCTDKFPFAAINHNSASSALYRIDVLLSWVEPMQFSPLPIKPNILDVNLNPNCDLISSKFPNFYNDVFHLMFLDDEDKCNFRPI